MFKSYSFTGGIRLQDQEEAIDIGAKVLVPSWDSFGIVVERKEGSRILGYFVRLDDGKVVDLFPSELTPSP